jgi:methionine-rich copper-binding protein CopC
MVRRLARLFLLTIFILATSITASTAHTSVVKTTPTYKSTLTELPSEIAIEFSEELMTIESQKINTIEMLHPDGSKIKITSLSVNKSTLTAKLPVANYVDGTYIVNYRVVSADGHSVSGSYELYLNTPSQKMVSAATIAKHENFFHVHKIHIYEAGVALILILLWWAYRRFSQEQGQ